MSQETSQQPAFPLSGCVRGSSCISAEPMFDSRTWRHPAAAHCNKKGNRNIQNRDIQSRLHGTETLKVSEKKTQWTKEKNPKKSSLCVLKTLTAVDNTKEEKALYARSSTCLPQTIRVCTCFTHYKNFIASSVMNHKV